MTTQKDIFHSKSRLFGIFLLFIFLETLILGFGTPVLAEQKEKQAETLNTRAKEAMVSGFDQKLKTFTVPKSPTLCSTLIRDVLEEHPRFKLYVSPVFHDIQDEGNGTYLVTPNYDTSFLSRVTSFLQNAPKNGTDAEKELFVHDNLCRMITYKKYNHSLRDVFVLHQADCQGYSQAMCACLDILNVKCRTITGDAGGPHMWNVVTLNGRNYTTDATFDDNKSDNNNPKHKYFNLSKFEMGKDHTPDSDQIQKSGWNSCIYPNTLVSPESFFSPSIRF